MIITNDIFKEKIANYANKNTKLSREVKAGKIFKIINGLYETNPNTPGYLLAGSIYGPSYISFEYALAFYGLIPERVSTITSATFNKKKKKKYNTSFGVYTLPPLKNYHNLEIMLFEDLRIDEEEFQKLDIEKLEKLSNLYHATNITLLTKYRRRLA